MIKHDPFGCGSHPDLPTSNDLLFGLTYRTIAQSVTDVEDVQNSPAISMGPYLIHSGQTELLSSISVYSERGTSRDQIRLLYMNAVALCVWTAMGKRPQIIDAQKRPPRTALLAYGVPFSE